MVICDLWRDVIASSGETKPNREVDDDEGSWKTAQIQSAQHELPAGAENFLLLLLHWLGSAPGTSSPTSCCPSLCSVLMSCILLSSPTSCHLLHLVVIAYVLFSSLTSCHLLCHAVVAYIPASSPTFCHCHLRPVVLSHILLLSPMPLLPAFCCCFLCPVVVTHALLSSPASCRHCLSSCRQLNPVFSTSCYHHLHPVISYIMLSLLTSCHPHLQYILSSAPTRVGSRNTWHRQVCRCFPVPLFFQPTVCRALGTNVSFGLPVNDPTVWTLKKTLPHSDRTNQPFSLIPTSCLCPLTVILVPVKLNKAFLRLHSDQLLPPSTWKHRISNVPLKYL